MKNIFNEGIETHIQWKTNLIKHIDEGVFLDIKKVGNCHACDLGKWIYGDGVRYNRLPSYESMCAAHEQFHRVAAEVVFHINANNKIKAKSLFSDDGDFSQSSAKLIKALMDCSKDLADSAVGDTKENRQKVKYLLKAKENDNIFSVEGHVPALDAIKIMVEHNVGSLAIFKEGDFLGIFTERGYLKHLLSKGKHSLDEPVSGLIDPNTISINPNDSVEQCMILMTATHTRHLPVIDADKLVGMVSIGAVIKNVVSNEKDQISQLEAYIQNSYGTQL